MYQLVYVPLELGPLFIFMLLAYFFTGGASSIVADMKPYIYFGLYFLSIIGFSIFCITMTLKKVLRVFIFLPIWLIVVLSTTAIYLDVYYGNYITDLQNTRKQSLGAEQKTLYLKRLFNGIGAEILNIETDGCTIMQAGTNNEIQTFLNYKGVSFLNKSRLNIEHIDINLLKNEERNKIRIFLPENFNDWLCIMNKKLGLNYCKTAYIITNGTDFFLVRTEYNETAKNKLSTLKYSEAQKIVILSDRNKEYPADVIKLRTEIIK